MKNSSESKTPTTRKYTSPVRAAQVEQTRLNILRAACMLARESETWDWRGITVRVVAERARVSERTVYRHFLTEQGLHEAMMRQLEEEAGILYDELALDDIPEAVQRMFASLPGFSVKPAVATHTIFAASDRRRREALLRATAPVTESWTAGDHELSAAVLDVLWMTPTYERMVTTWQLDHSEAVRGITWAVNVLLDAIRDGRRPVLSSTTLLKDNEQDNQKE